MARICVLLTTLILLATIGCEQKDDQTGIGNETAIAACPGCGHTMAEDTYCAKCNAVATTETDLVHCNVCDKDFKPGTYCGKCNRFMLNATVGCVKCQGQVAKGHYCANEQLFKGLPGIVYCQKHQRPYQGNLTCPDCEKEDRFLAP